MQPKFFAHRGLVSKNAPENTIASLKNAFENNIKAVEFDIWYFKNELVVSHDQPKNKILKLNDYLAVYSNKIEYWLDFKNLNISNCDQALKQVKIITKQLKIKQNNLNFAPFITNFDQALEIYKIIKKYFKKAKILAVREKLKISDRKKYYQKLQENKIFGLSINYKNIDDKLIKNFKNIEIFAWTVNNRKTADYLAKIGVQNIVSDKIL
jgi:glycerophosphoryl diester phosphodiesterase